MEEWEAVQEVKAVQGGERQALSPKLKMQKDLASRSNILTKQEVETTASRHLSAQMVPLENVFPFPSPQLQGT